MGFIEKPFEDSRQEKAKLLILQRRTTQRNISAEKRWIKQGLLTRVKAKQAIEKHSD